MRISPFIAALAIAACVSDHGGTEAGADGAPGADLEAIAAEHAHDTPTASPAVGVEPRAPVIEQELAYGEGADRNLIGYLAMPADAVEPQPGLLVVHEWWGLNDNIRAMTRRLAGEGFVVLAVDLYGGATATTPEQAQALMAQVAQMPEVTLDNLRQGYEYLDRYALAPRVGALGWCLGGTWVLQAGIALASELDSVVMYYGQVVQDRDQLAALDMPVLGLFAATDSSIPVADVQDFRVALNQLGKDADIRIYPDVGHAFANPSGETYDPQAAEDAWQRTVDFLNRTLR